MAAQATTATTANSAINKTRVEPVHNCDVEEVIAAMKQNAKINPLELFCHKINVYSF